jgi:hypothetical protein
MEEPTPITTNLKFLSPQDAEDEDEEGDSQKLPAPPQFQYDPAYGISTPAPNDIVCGRGKMTVAHLGNRRFRKLVMARKDDYQKARRRDHKTRITLELVQQLRGGPDGGRYVNRGWSFGVDTLAITERLNVLAFFVV